MSACCIILCFFLHFIADCDGHQEKYLLTDFAEYSAPPLSVAQVHTHTHSLSLSLSLSVCVL
jgi:hypothetical protein